MNGPFLTALKANFLSLLVLAKTIHHPFQCQKHTIKRGIYYFDLVSTLKTFFQPQFLA